MKFLYLTIAIFFFPSPSQAATGKTVLVAGRVKVTENAGKPACEICVGCEALSGGARRSIECGSDGFLDGVKYKLRVTPTRIGGKCVLRTQGAREILPPEANLPFYPDQKELENSLDCT